MTAKEELLKSIKDRKVICGNIVIKKGCVVIKAVLPPNWNKEQWDEWLGLLDIDYEVVDTLEELYTQKLYGLVLMEDDSYLQRYYDAGIEGWMLLKRPSIDDVMNFHV